MSGNEYLSVHDTLFKHTRTNTNIHIGPHPPRLVISAAVACGDRTIWIRDNAALGHCLLAISGGALIWPFPLLVMTNNRRRFLLVKSRFEPLVPNPVSRFK